tara:strand:- start:744 stop:923 length:180 start_codon:yes stop_codon:yes gene_type:complete
MKSKEFYRIFKSIKYSERESQINSILNWIDLFAIKHDLNEAKHLKKLAYNKLSILTNTF